MTREELKEHCQRQIEGCEMWARHNGEEPHGKIYEEHKLILELLEQGSILDKIRAETSKLQTYKILDEAITRYVVNAEYERTHGKLQGCLEFRQLAKWLKELRSYREIYHKEHEDDCLRAESENKE